MCSLKDLAKCTPPGQAFWSPAIPTPCAPDAAFIQTSRLPLGSAVDSWVRVTPDLVVEVVASGDRANEIADKIRMWLDVGVRLIWVAHPQRRAIEVYRPGEPVLLLGIADHLDGYDVVPSFSAPVAQVFP